MLFRLLLIFVIVAIIEIYLLIKVASLIGGAPTVALLLLISFLGAYILRRQGLAILITIRTELSQGRLPAARLLDGALILMGALLLLIPGFFTDFLGIFFLIPSTRSIIKLWLGRWLAARLAGGSFLMRRH